MTDVIIIGGGVIGLLSALRLAQAGLSVEVFEQSDPATESSWAGLGVLSPSAAPNRPSELVTLMQASLDLYPALADELRAQTNIDVCLRREGMLHVALDDADWKALRADAAQQRAADVPVVELSAREALMLEPCLSADIAGAIHFMRGWQVDNLRLNSALIMAAREAGVLLHAWQAVKRVVRAGEHVAGVQVGRDTHLARWVVVAAGAWSGSLEGVSLPVRPAKGQALMLQMPADVVSYVIDSHLGYIVPRLDGRMVVGATVENAGFDKQVTEDAIEHLLRGAQRVVPALKDAKVRETWAGLRPRSADDSPILGPVAGCDGLIVATGHFRNGILLAPITAQLVTEWITDQPTSVDVGKFSPNRFK
jgi:glycine oxidase